MTCKDCVHNDICEKLRPIEYCMNITCSHFKNKANFVEVVRCKDCQHYIDGKCYVSNRKPRFAYNVNIHRRKEDDYCSYGERKCE